MRSFSTTLCVFSLLLSVSALSSPHAARNIHHHRALALRIPNPAPSNSSLPTRAKRCKAPHSQSSSPVPVNVAPTPDVKPPVPPAPQVTSSTPEPSPTPTPPKTSDKPQPSNPPSSNTTSNGNLPPFLVGTQSGQGTFYETGLGACGIVNTDHDFIVAVSHLLYDAFPGYDGVNPNTNPVCNKKIKATYQGRSVTVTVTDRCTACAITDLDFSPDAFGVIASAEVGRIFNVSWDWVD